jgi:hypothetical protein
MVLLLDCCDEVRENGGTDSALRGEAHEFADAAIALHSRDGVDGVKNRIVFGHIVENPQADATADGSSDYFVYRFHWLLYWLLLLFGSPVGAPCRPAHGGAGGTSIVLWFNGLVALIARVGQHIAAVARQLFLATLRAGIREENSSRIELCVCFSSASARTFG